LGKAQKQATSMASLQKESRLWRAFSIQRRVVHALFLRELKTRFGRHRLGYVWALLEPAAHMLVLFGVLGLLARHVMPDISFPVFLICGLVPFFMFNNIAVRSLNAIEANLGLLSYRPVHPVDTLLARAWLELLISASVFILLLVTLSLAGEEVELADIPGLCAIWGLLALLSLGLGVAFMVIGHEFPMSEKFIPLLVRPLYFGSAVMYSPTALPEQYRAWVLWNPLAHAFELLRHTVVPTYPIGHVSLGYLAGWTLAVLFVGVALYKAREPSLLRS
jgi:capsular polysaccharide transport system permease protein